MSSEHDTTTQPEAVADTREAAHDFHRYLSDELAPMMAVDSVETLLRLPPELMASTIQAWIGAQYRGQGGGVSISDYLFHAAKKLSQMVEYDLVERPTMEAFLVALRPLLVGMCPPEDRPYLEENLARIDQAAETGSVAPVQMLHRQAGGQPLATTRAAQAAAPTPAQGPAAATAPALPQDFAQGMRRFSVLLERLAHLPAQAAPETKQALTPQAVAVAAAHARTADDLERQMERLRALGIASTMDQVFRALGQGIPGWAIPGAGGEGALALPESYSLRAMHRIITMAPDPEEGAKRFEEMLKAAVEQFNSGSLAQAVAMVDLASRIVEERKLRPDVLEATRRRCESALSLDALRQYSEKPEKHPLLRRVLAFFPGYGPRGALEALHNEPRRDRRRLFLALLEIHGAEARAAALERLATFAENPALDPSGYFVRNLVFLLRRVPPPESGVSERERELLVQLSGWGTPLLVIRETVAALGQIRHDKAEATLIARLQEAEQMLAGGRESIHEAGDLRGLLDWIVTALTRQATPDAVRAVVDHAFERHAALGDTMARLDELQGLDLSRDPELLARLIKSLRHELPTRVLGLVVSKNPRNAVHLIRCLSKTPAPEVRQLLEEIASRFTGQEIATEASKALAAVGAREVKEEASTSLTGDVELFGLPNLLQSLADSRVTGVLTLQDRECETVGLLGFESGLLRSVQVGGLQGEEALYQLFEKPIPGNFLFRRRQEADKSADAGQGIEVMPAMLEALRRHDEFQLARAMAPDGAKFRATATKPAPLADETDLALMRTVWVKAAAGVPAEECEAAVAVDAYRIRRLYAHWIEGGALAPG